MFLVSIPDSRHLELVTGRKFLVKFEFGVNISGFRRGQNLHFKKLPRKINVLSRFPSSYVFEPITGYGVARNDLYGRKRGIRKETR